MSGTDPEPPLGLELAVAAPHASGALDVELKVENVSAVPVLVNSRLAIHAEHAPDVFREVSFEIQDAHGNPVRFGSRINRGHPRPSDVRELAPGESLRRSYRLADYFDLAAPGNYRVRARYATSPIADEQGRGAWQGVAVSNWVTVTR